MMLILNFIALLLFLITAFTVLYTFIFSVAGNFARTKEFKHGDLFKKIAVFIPCHKQDESILRTAEHALFQKYPSHRYDVIVIGDALQQLTVDKLKKLPLKYIEAHYDISAKAKALNVAFDELKDNYDIAIILDADQFMKPDFLDKINTAFIRGCYAVQGHKILRNTSTNIATLEGLIIEINNHIFRKGQQAFGFSSAVTGSAIAFSYKYLKLVVEEMKMEKGFDKELELKLVEDNHRIIYIEDAIVTDDKIMISERFTHQRSDWIFSQFSYFKSHVSKGILSMLFGKFDYANKIAHFALVPKVILLTFLLIVTAISWYFNPDLIIGFNAWATISVLYVIAFLIAIPFRYYNLTTLKAVASLPWSFLLIFKELFIFKTPAAPYMPHGAVTQFENQTKEK